MHQMVSLISIFWPPTMVAPRPIPLPKCNPVYGPVLYVINLAYIKTRQAASLSSSVKNIFAVHSVCLRD